MTAPHSPNSSSSSGSPAPASGAQHGIVKDDGRQLVELLTQQQVIYNAITKLASQQSELVAQADAQALLTHLGQRQHLVDRLGEINQKLEPYRRDWQNVYESLPAEVQVKVGALVQQAQTSLEQIIGQDEADRKHLEQSRASMGQEIRQVSKGGMAAAAYGRQAGKTGPRYTNHQG